eukprot:2321924-Amphidinium_carterae.1
MEKQRMGRLQQRHPGLYSHDAAQSGSSGATAVQMITHIPSIDDVTGTPWQYRRLNGILCAVVCRPMKDPTNLQDDKMSVTVMQGLKRFVAPRVRPSSNMRIVCVQRRWQKQPTLLKKDLASCDGATRHAVNCLDAQLEESRTGTKHGRSNVFFCRLGLGDGCIALGEPFCVNRTSQDKRDADDAAKDMCGKKAKLCAESLGA